MKIAGTDKPATKKDILSAQADLMKRRVKAGDIICLRFSPTTRFFFVVCNGPQKHLEDGVDDAYVISDGCVENVWNPDVEKVPGCRVEIRYKTENMSKPESEEERRYRDAAQMIVEQIQQSVAGGLFPPPLTYLFVEMCRRAQHVLS